MKKLTLLFIAFIAILSFTACTEDDDFTFTAKPDPDGIAFMNQTANTYTLRAPNTDNLAERFVWNEVDFGVQTPVNYELQGAGKEAFSNYSVLGDVTENNLAVTVGDMLELANEAGLDNDPETDAPNSGNIYFRVRAYVGTDAANVVEQTSDILSVSVTLPESSEGIELKRELYLVGDATAAGWNNNNNNTPIFRDGENDDIYYFDGRFAGGDGVEGFKLLESFIRERIIEFNKNNIKLKIIGNINVFNKKLKKKLQKSEKLTKNNKRLQVNLALNYGSKLELINAFNKINKNNLNVNIKNIEKYLYTSNIPDPDILIRTGSTHRLSNFLLWQLAYSEIFFEKKLWPDFKENDYNKILKKFRKTKRNYGNI